MMTNNNKNTNNVKNIGNLINKIKPTQTYI